MRVSVSRFDDLLSIAELGSKIHLVVAVFGSLGKQGAKCTKELRKQVVAIVHPQRQAPVQVSGSGVWRAEQDTLVASQKIARFGNSSGYVKGFESPLGRHR